ncbi:MAG: hypothetical protein WBQ79_18500 [Acidobacteriaceae bacterium]
MLKESQPARAGAWCAAVFLLALGAIGCRGARQPDASATETETIVVLRHGEKAPGGLGQLSCKGLNRALALPKVLIGRFGRADAIFAPNPSVDVREGALTQKEYSYVRPLATIEPTAIALGLPVNAQIGFPDIAGLQAAVTAPAFANSTVFIAWEHKYAYDFARAMLKSYGLDRALVPAWPGDDFETMYVLRITRAAGAASPTMTFAVEQEGLSASLVDRCP